ncbi:MAG: TerB family tellurite resistance protein [Phyllobacterium sp.]
MTESILDRISAFLGTRNAVQKVADDPALTAELLLLLHLVLADGESQQEEISMLARIAEADFGIPAKEFGEVTDFLRDFGYETSPEQAVLAFEELPAERKISLLRHLLAIAKADDELHPTEAAIIRRTADRLGITAEDLRKVREG